MFFFLPNESTYNREQNYASMDGNRIHGLWICTISTRTTFHPPLAHVKTLLVIEKCCTAKSEIFLIKKYLFGERDDFFLSLRE